MAKETVKFDQIKDYSWLSDAAKEKDAKALKSAYRKQAAKTGFARFFINFLPVIFFGPLFHMAYWFVNAIVVAYKKAQEQSADIGADPEAEAKQPKAAFYWDWSRVFDGINEKVIQLRTVKKYIVDSAETDAEDSVESVNVVDSDQDDESTSQDDKAFKKSSSSSTTEKEAAKTKEPNRMTGSVAEPKEKEAEKASKKKPVKEDDKAKEKLKKNEVKAKVKTKEAPKKKDNKVDAKREEERLRQEAEAKREEERLRQEAEAKREEERLRQEAEAQREEERLRQEAETKREEERLRQEAETKREEERLRQEAETKHEEERLRKEAETKLREELLKVEEKKPEAKGWFASLFGSSEPTDTSSVIKETQNVEQTPPVSDAEVKQAQAELGVGGEVMEPALESPKKLVMVEEAVAVEKPVETAKTEEKAEVKPDAQQGVIASLYSWWNTPKQPAQPPLPPTQHEVRTPNNSYNTIDADLGGRDPKADADEHVVTKQPQAHVEINLEDLGDELVDHDLMGSVERIAVDPNANTATIV